MLFKAKYDITVDNPGKLKGKIIIGYCRAQETFINFIRLQGYKDQYKRLLARKFSHTNNGKRVLKNVISKKDLLKYPHLRLKGEIIIRKDFNNIPEVDLRSENYFPVTVRVWSNDFDARNTSPIESDISDSQIIVSSNYF